METLPFGLVKVVLVSTCILHNAIVTTSTKSCDVDSPDVRSIDIRLPLINVPADQIELCNLTDRTSCWVPDDTEYHAIAFEPIIYNKGLVHHMILFGCSFHIEDLKPHPCGRLDNRCNTWLVQWSVGMENRICAPPSGGVPFGKNIFSYLSIQVHWNNDGEEVNITGTEGYIRLYRKGKMIQEIAHDWNYTYMTSPVHHLPNGVRINPGDEIRVTCVYNTLTDDRFREETTSFGEGSDAEMCYAFVTYFPAVENFNQCIQLDDLDVNC